MVSKDDIKKVLDKMILSASGWRGVFAADGAEESRTDKISEAHVTICGASALVFAEYLGSGGDMCKPVVLIGSDSRPTGKAIADIIIPVLITAGCEVRYAGVVSAPEIMAWARKVGTINSSAGFIYISASHNPIGHNGLKFGLIDGGVLAAEEIQTLIENLKTFLDSDVSVSVIKALVTAVNPQQIGKVTNNIQEYKSNAFKAYYDFCCEVVNDEQKDNASCIDDALKEGLAKKPIGIVCDFNGSARAVSIDKVYFSGHGINFQFINDVPGEIVHRIVPEGDALLPCAKLLEDAQKKDASFILGYVPDCDGDRGNIVIWNDTEKKAQTLDAQEVFALAVAAELSQLVYTGKLPSKAAIAINDPTSMRIDKIAQCFGIQVFRAEVGEANVVTLARNLRDEGYLVRIMGEGSAGGNITHPSAVRDPVNTVMAIAKMLSIRSSGDKECLFKIWCNYSGQSDKYREDFSLADIIASLPSFVTTSVYENEACLQVKSGDHGALKDKYHEVFLREWEKQKDELKTRFGIIRWEAIAYNGTEEKRGIERFGEAGRGGLKILFFNADGIEAAYIWMRGSATEPVFRIMADVQGTDKNAERFLLDWQRKMIMEADGK